MADISSCFLSEPVDVTKYGLLYGGAQKNVGPAGVVIVIIREDLITEDVLPGTPTICQYKVQADAKSLYNTPPCYGILHLRQGIQMVKKRGGLEAMKEYNEKKAKILYDFLDQSKLFKGTVAKGPLLNERSVCHRRQRSGRRVCQRGNRSRICKLKKATEP